MINLTIEVQELDTENYETLLIEIKEYLNKWKNIVCVPITRPYIKMVTFPILTYKFK